MYADDTSIVISAITLEDLLYRVNFVLEQFHVWCYKNRLIINYEKTVCMLFKTKSRHIPSENMNITINGHQLKIHSDTKFLGITIDENITWTKHIDQLCCKLRQSCFAVTVLKNKLDEDSLINIYYALFYSKVSYNIIIWGQSSDVQRVFVLQKRVIRTIFNMKPLDSCRNAFKKYKILTLVCIYLYKVLSYIHNKRADLKIHSDNHAYSTRTRQYIYIEKYNLTLYKKSPICAGSYLYNMLPMYIKELKPINKFKIELKKFLCANSFYSVEDYLNYKG